MNIDVLGTEIPPDLSSSTEGDNGNGDVLQTSLCIGLGVFVGLLMIIMVSLTLWRRSRPRPPQSSKHSNNEIDHENQMAENMRFISISNTVG